MSPRFASAITSSPPRRASAQTAPERGESGAAQGLEEGHLRLHRHRLRQATASITPRQNRSYARARPARPGWRPPITSGGSSSIRGSRPTQIALCSRPPPSASRSAKVIHGRVPSRAAGRRRWRARPAGRGDRPQADAGACERRRDDPRRVRLHRHERPRPAAGRGLDRQHQRCDLEQAVAGARQPSSRHHAAAGAGERLHEPVVDVGGEQHAAAAGRASQPGGAAADAVDRVQPVANGGRVLVALVGGERGHPLPESAQLVAVAAGLDPPAQAAGGAGVGDRLVAPAAGRVTGAEHAREAAGLVVRQRRPARAESEGRAQGSDCPLRLAAAGQRAQRGRARLRLRGDGQPRHRVGVVSVR